MLFLTNTIVMALFGLERLFFNVLQPIYDNLLRPILDKIMEAVFRFAYDLIYKYILEEILYKLMMLIFKIIDYIEEIVRYLLGINSEMLDESQLDLVSILLTNSRLNRVLIILILISFLLTAVLILRRAMSDIIESNNDRAPFVSLLKKVLRTWLRLALTYFYCLIIMNAVRVGAISIAKITNNVKPIMSNTVFVLSVKDALKDGKSQKEILTNYMEQKEPQYKYNNSKQTKEDFNREKFNYPYMVLLSVLTLWIFAKLIFKLLRRIVNLAILYLIGPFFAAMSLVKGDEKAYEKWQNMFYANFLNILFVIIGYYIFTIISKEIVIDFDMQFSSHGWINSFLQFILVVSILNSVPDTMKFGYNLLTDMGRFLAQDELTLNDLSIASVFGLK